MSLLDIINQNRQALGSQNAPAPDQTQKVQSLLSAKSGRDVSGSLPTVSNLGEQQAAAQTRQQMKTEVQPALQMQAAQGQAQEQAQKQQFSGQMQQIGTQQMANKAQYNIKANQILNQLEQGKEQLSLEQKQSKMEQASFLMAMQDQKYVTQLQQIGQMKRLDNAANFEKEMQDMEFKDSMRYLQDKMGMDNVLAVNDRDYKKKISAMSIEDAIQIADIEADANEDFATMQRDLIQTQTNFAAKAAAMQNMSQGLQTVISGGAKAYTAYKEPKQNQTISSQEEQDIAMGR